MAFSTDIGIDLGTASILVYVRGKGVVLNEPAVVAIEQQRQKVLAVGTTAQKMLGRTPENIVALRPLREGVIADFDIAEIMLKHCLARAMERRRFLRPRVVVCIPAGATSVEKKAVVEAIARTGARETFLIEEPRAAALGAGLNIFEPSGNMVVDVGGGTSDIAVLSMGEVVEGASVSIGGDKFDEAIIQFVKKEYDTLIGERTAESLKMKIGSAHPASHSLQAEVRGRDLVTGLPRSVTLSTSQVVQALEEPLWAILQGIKQVLERTPPELAGDIVNKGIVLSGGGALLDGFTQFLSQGTGVPFYLAEEPITCVVKGTAFVLENMARFGETLFSSRNTDVAF
ncbi:MAG: rod shape-determining protein [Dethiobacteria bacterium]|nr:rod shape-determining protein [Bacillota bacterium]NMD34192.1 rod shape-determining protein [Bacillota bacterium]HOB28611.1 rod shape-determining protein [Bacillota bacterium]HPZ41299.1 rod shape-determining protein [Bacillota bacterium]